MQSKKLTKQEKNYIVDVLVEPYIESSRNNEKFWMDKLEDYIRTLTPEKILKVQKTYPGVVRTVGYKYFGSKLASPHRRCHVSLHCPTFPGLDDILDSSKKVIALLEEFGLAEDNLFQEANTMKKKILCILNNITTSNKLQEEFPEAYEVWLQTQPIEEADKIPVDLKEIIAEVKNFISHTK